MSAAIAAEIRQSFNTSENPEEESATSEKPEEESATSRRAACATCGCTCQSRGLEEFIQVENVPGPETGAIPKRSGWSSSGGQERRSASKEEIEARPREETPTGSGGGGASATPEGPQDREIPQGHVIPAGGPVDREGGRPEGDSE